MQPRILTDDPTAIADFDTAIPFGINWWQRPGAGRGQPEPQKVTFLFRFRPIFERGAVM